MKCICCGKETKYGWQIKESFGICENCLAPIETLLKKANVELNDITNTYTFEETKKKVINAISEVNEKEFITALMDKINSVVTSRTPSDYNFSSNVSAEFKYVNNEKSTNSSIDLMSFLKNTFNFDNIGTKMKKLAKWSCWITILLIWIAAPIAFIALVSDEWTAELCWIPLVSAIVAPFIIWIGSWAMYAFGEFVEDIHAMRNKENASQK